MTFTVFIGWWLVPTFTTLGAISWCYLRLREHNQQPAYGYGKIGQAFVQAWYTAIMIIVILASWLAFLIYVVSTG